MQMKRIEEKEWMLMKEEGLKVEKEKECLYRRGSGNDSRIYYTCELV